MMLLCLMAVLDRIFLFVLEKGYVVLCSQDRNLFDERGVGGDLCLACWSYVIVFF